MIDTDKPLSSAREIADAIGRAEISRAVGVRASAVSMALSAGPGSTFPASWLLAVLRLAKLGGYKVSPQAFRWKGASINEDENSVIMIGRDETRGSALKFAHDPVGARSEGSGDALVERAPATPEAAA